jgi:spore germination protein KC
MKRTAAVLLLLAVLTTGCWNRKEADHIDYVLAVGIDKADDGNITLTIQSPVLEALKPKSGEGDKFKTLSVYGQTTFEGIRNYINITGQKLFWGHTQVYLIGEKAAKDGVEQYLDFFTADAELRGTSHVAVVKGMAKDLMEAKTEFTPIPANYMSNLIKNAGLNGKSPTIVFSDFNRMLAEPTGSQPYLPVMELMSQKEYDATKAGIKTKSSSGSNQTPIVYTAGTAVFHNTKLVGFLNEKESRGLLWTKRTLTTTIVVVNCGDNCTASLELIGGVKNKKLVKMDGDTPKVKISVEANMNIGDRSGFIDVSDEAVIRNLEEGFSKVVKSEIEAAFRKAAKLKSDILAFGNSLSDRNPKEWEQVKDRWDQEIFPNSELEITVKGHIRRTSRTLYSPWVQNKSP